MLITLNTTANPGHFDRVDPHLSSEWWWLLLVTPVVVGAIVFAAQLLLGHWKAPKRDHTLTELTLGTFIGVSFTIALIGILIGYSVLDTTAQEDARAEWNAEVAEWLADDYGLTFTADEVGDMQPSPFVAAPKTIVDGEIEYIELTELAGDLIAVVTSDGDVIQPTAKR
jgi:hypothetical protein